MAQDVNPPRPLASDQLKADATDLIDILIDLASGKRQGFRAAQANFPQVADEVVRNQAQWGERAGITQIDFELFLSTSDKIARIDQILPRVIKLQEVLIESRAYYENERQHLVLMVAESVDRRSRNAPELLALYDQTRKYRSASGVKATKTRRRNEATATGKGNRRKGTTTSPATTPATPPTLPAVTIPAATATASASL